MFAQFCTHVMLKKNGQKCMDPVPFLVTLPSIYQMKVREKCIISMYDSKPANYRRKKLLRVLCQKMNFDFQKKTLLLAFSHDNMCTDHKKE